MQDFIKQIASLSLFEKCVAEHDKTALLAWRARNLLELSVWCLYCSKSRANARCFYEDYTRDLLGILAAFTKWGTDTAQGPEWLDPMTGQKQNLTQQAISGGIVSPDGPYKRIQEAADEVGIGGHFAVSNKFLSKFAHPTAVRILMSLDTATEGVHNDMFYSQGCLFFAGGFQAVEDQLLRK